MTVADIANSVARVDEITQRVRPLPAVPWGKVAKALALIVPRLLGLLVGLLVRGVSLVARYAVAAFMDGLDQGRGKLPAETDDPHTLGV